MSTIATGQPSSRFRRLLKLSITSFICMGVLIGYHGAPVINSFIGLIWLLFVITAGSVTVTALSSKSEKTLPGNFRTSQRVLELPSARR